MSDFDVPLNEMTTNGLTDAQIEALISGAPVSCPPGALADLIASLQQRGAAAPTLAARADLGQFFTHRAEAHHLVANATPQATSQAQRPTPWLAKAAALLGLIPTSLLIGATVATAAVGGAQILGIVDVPFLPSRGHQVESPPPADTELPTSVVAVTIPPTAVSVTTPEQVTGQAPASSTPPTSARPSSVPASPPANPHATVPPTPPGHANPAATAAGCAPTTVPGGPPAANTIHTSAPAGACDPVVPQPSPNRPDNISTTVPTPTTRNVDPGRTPSP